MGISKISVPASKLSTSSTSSSKQKTNKQRQAKNPTQQRTKGLYFPNYYSFQWIWSSAAAFSVSELSWAWVWLSSCPFSNVCLIPALAGGTHSVSLRRAAPFPHPLKTQLCALRATRGSHLVVWNVLNFTCLFYCFPFLPIFTGF